MDIQIQQLNHHYSGAQSASLDGINLSINSQQVFGLLGPNGAGKTTLISIISGLINQTSGNLLIDGLEMKQDRKTLLNRMALVPQEYAFYPQLTVQENLHFFSGVQRIDKKMLSSRINDVSAITDLTSFYAKKAGQLSGGLKRRLNIAIGLLNNPELLILDEPTVGIDPQSRRFILDSVKRISQQGTTIIYTSHYMDEVEYLCDSVAIIDKGNVLMQGTLETLLRGHQMIIDFTHENIQNNVTISLAHSWENNGRRLMLHELPAEKLSIVLSQLGSYQSDIQNVHYGKGSLEQVFLEATGSGLRD